MTVNSTRKKLIRARMAATGEPYSVAAKSVDQKTFGVPLNSEPQECPTWFTWSAFGASYPDTACSTGALEGEENHGVLCDLDADYSDIHGISCPFCDPNGFLTYEWGGGYSLPYWFGTEEPVPHGTPILFNEQGDGLISYARHHKHGLLRVVMVELDETESDEIFDEFIPYQMSNGDTL